MLPQQTFKKEECRIFKMSVFCIPLPPSKVLTYFMDIQKLLDSINGLVITGKSFSEALILASTNPQYDEKLFMVLP